MLFSLCMLIAGFSFLSCATVSSERECINYISSNKEDNIDTSWAEPIAVKELPDLFKINQDVYRSAQPTKGGLIAAQKMGIKTVLSLRQTKRDAALEEDEASGLNLVHIPIVTSKASEQNIIDALTVIRDAPKPILIHCRHGADRTGLISAAYRLVFQGWPKACAKEELINGGFGFHKMWKSIPKKIDELDVEKIKKELGL